MNSVCNDLVHVHFSAKDYMIAKRITLRKDSISLLKINMPLEKLHISESRFLLSEKLLS